MIYFVFIGYILLFILFIPVRIITFHPIKTIYYAFVDFYYYFKYKQYNFFEAGKLDCYSAHFGGGKTLSIVHYVCNIFYRYNNKEVWDRSLNCFVKQKIHIISNVKLFSVPYEPLVSLSQVVSCAYNNKKIDIDNYTRTVVFVIIDEASSQLNSRAFKTNIDATFLNTLITSRHYHINILYSSQKFKLTDALMRNVTQRVINCKKVWRFLIQNVYSADEVENTTDLTFLKPLYRTGFLILNKDFKAYDTLATVDMLKKSVEENDMMSEQEILSLRATINPNEMPSRPSRKFFKFRNKGK